MKRIITREIFIEIETIRVTQKRSGRKNAAESPKSDDAASDKPFVDPDARVKPLFDKLYSGEF